MLEVPATRGIPPYFSFSMTVSFLFFPLSAGSYNAHKLPQKHFHFRIEWNGME